MAYLLNYDKNLISFTPFSKVHCYTTIPNKDMIIINQHWHVIVIKVLILNVTNMLKCCHCFMSLNSVFFIHFLRKTGLFPLSICQGLSVMNTSYSLRVLTLSFNCYTCREQIDAAEGIWLLTKLMTIILAATWCSQTTLLLNPFMP